MRIFALFVLLAALTSTATAGPALTRGVLPTRSAHTPELRALVDAVARRLGADGAPPPFALAPTVERADALAAAGRLDEAAALYDVAIDQGTRAPLDVADPTALVHAHVARATIGLARGETDRAEALLARLVRWDPTFALSATEATPRVSAALERVVQRLGARPSLERGDLGDGCSGTSLAARPLADGVELVRIADCRVAASVIARSADDPASLAATLGFAAPTTPARPRPLWRRGWLWGTVAAVSAALAGAAVGIWAATRTSDDWHVTPHL